MSNDRIEIDVAALVDGDNTTPDAAWLNLDEMFWDATAAWPVYAEITFKQPIDVTAVTINQHIDHR